jgi:sulfate/thiosulfate transport system substrate-binding protein
MNIPRSLRLVSLVIPVVLALGACSGSESRRGEGVTLLNVSYDPTRELYNEINPAFAKHWLDTRGQSVTFRMSHGGAGKQARAVIDGLEADVVTLALAYDIDLMHERANLVPADWQSRLPHNSCPYTSTIVFLVREGNPKAIRDWGDLAKPGVSVITPNPKTSGGARWNYLAAWGWAVAQERGGVETLRTLEGVDPNASASARELVTRIFRNVPVLDSGARGSTNTFVQNNVGDVLLAWENEARLAIRELGEDKFDIVMPSISILAEPPVTVVDAVVDRKGTREVAEAYLAFLFTPEGQEIVAKHHYRPSDPEVAARRTSLFPSVELFTIDEVFGGWKEAQRIHFADGGTFDQIYDPRASAAR